jgi:hypothetical protein
LATSCRRVGTSFTESSGILPDFPWTEWWKAKVSTIRLVLMGDILSPGGD